MIEQILVTLPLVLGAYITLSRLKLPDFGLESAYLFGAVMAYLLPLQPLAALMGGMMVGALIVLLNQRLPYLLAAIVVSGIVHGCTLFLLGSSIVSLPYTIDPLYVSLPLLLLMILLLLSPLGKSFAIYGNNPRFFESHGMAGSYVLLMGILAGHGAAGIGGFLFAQSSGFVDITMNYGLILLCLVSLMLGKLVRLPPAGVILYFSLQQLLLRLGFDLKYFNLVQAVAVLLILMLRKRNNYDFLGV